MIERILTFLLEAWRNRESAKLFGAARSPEWRRVRAEHLRKFPTCAVCGGTETLEVHHVKNFADYPEEELNPQNLLTLCEANKKGITCHRAVGHLGNYRKINPEVREAAKYLNGLFTKYGN